MSSITPHSGNAHWTWALEYTNLLHTSGKQPQSNGIAERLVGMSKMLVKRLRDSSDLSTDYWNYAITHAADLLRHRAIKLDLPMETHGNHGNNFFMSNTSEYKTSGSFRICVFTHLIVLCLSCGVWLPQTL
eukprot:5772593-Amphidinium_carterae.1